MYPHSCGMLGLAHRGFELDDYSQHLASFLKDYNYETVLCGIQHVAPDANMIGYDKIITCDERGMGHGTDFDTVAWDVENTNTAAKYIKEAKSPYFLSFGLFNTHRKFPPVAEDINVESIKVPAPLPDTREIREDMAGYITSARVMDECVGAILDAVKESGKEDETMIIFTTDHGIAFPIMKCSLYDSGINVSLMIKSPTDDFIYRRIDSLVSQIDLFPTICDLLSLEKPDWIQGKSLMPVIKDECSEVNEEIFSEITFHAAYEPVRCIRTKRYKLIKYFDNYDKYILSNIDNGLSKKSFLESGIDGMKRPQCMLFDLFFDPNEKNNLMDNKKYKSIKCDLERRLASWMEVTDDPLIHGKVKVPEGARVNHVSCVHASEKNFI